MTDNILSFNMTNLVTVCVMGFVGFAVIGGIVTIIKRAYTND